CMQALQTPHSL
nr:immunoglobulin light chain junction region [Macaca mulatta]